ncbi:MAG: hypothetical protein HY560_13250 [Gemmatimonadetes bacterium]|nr:hypothetical protein [Gemmatimonadota bacterium]
MKKLIKVFVLLLVVGVIGYAMSYAGARTAAGRFLGNKPPDMGTRSIRFAFGGVAGLPGQPRAWEFTYSRASINANKPVKIYVSLGGDVLGTVPKDLDRRLEAYTKTREPQ